MKSKTLVFAVIKGGEKYSDGVFVIKSKHQFDGLEFSFWEFPNMETAKNPQFDDKLDKKMRTEFAAYLKKQFKVDFELGSQIGNAFYNTQDIEFAAIFLEATPKKTLQPNDDLKIKTVDDLETEMFFSPFNVHFLHTIKSCFIKYDM